MTTIVVNVAKRGRRIKEPPFFLLREIISTYNTLATVDGKNQARLVRKIFTLVFGFWWGHWLVLSLKPAELAELLSTLPTQLGLESDSKAAAGNGWGDVYAHLAATFGWSYVDISLNMTLSRLKEMHGYLQSHPPTHLLVAAYLQYEPPLTIQEKKKRFFERFNGSR